MSATETHWLAPAIYPALIAFVCAVVVFLWRKMLEVRSVKPSGAGGNSTAHQGRPHPPQLMGRSNEEKRY